MVYIDLIHSETSKFTKVTKISLIVIYILTIALAYFFDYKNIESNVPVFFLCLIILIAIVKFIHSCLKKEFITIGNMFLYDDSITMSKSKIIDPPMSIIEIDSISITYYGYLGEPYPYYIDSYQNFQSKDGNKNYIQIIRKTHVQDWEFFLANRAQLLNLIRQLRIYQNKGLCVSMTDDLGRNMFLNRY